MATFPPWHAGLFDGRMCAPMACLAHADPQRHACAGGRILVRVTDALVPDAEPLEVPIEDCYADLVERRVTALSR